MKHFEKVIVAGLVSSIILGASSVYAKQKPTYESSDGVHVGARVTYRYLPDSLFRVKAKIRLCDRHRIETGRSGHVHRWWRYDPLVD